MASATTFTGDRIPSEFFLAIAVAKLGGEMTLDRFDLEQLMRDPDGLLQTYEVMDPPGMVVKASERLTKRFKPLDKRFNDITMTSVASPAAPVVKEVPEENIAVPPHPRSVFMTDAMLEAGYDATRDSQGNPRFADAGFCLGHVAEIYAAMQVARFREDKGPMVDIDDLPYRPRRSPPQFRYPEPWSPAEVGIGIVLSFVILGVAKMFGLL